MKYSAIIVAAGVGSRMNLGYNKVFYTMKDGKTVLEKTVQCFNRHSDCAEIIIVTQKENFDLCDFKTEKPLILTEGGATRSESVTCGLNRAKEEYVMVHDGARPYVSSRCLDRLVECLNFHDACILAVPCKDTIKVVKDGKIVDTPVRSSLYQAQTPQAFKRSLLEQCYKKAELDGTLTDDASCVEKYGDTDVVIVEGDYANIKITTIEDIKE